MNHEIKFICSHCGQKMVADAVAIGLRIACPGCGNELMVPRESNLQTPTPTPTPSPAPVQSHPETPAPDRPMPRTSTVSETISSNLSSGLPPDPRQELIAASVQNSRLEGQIAELRQQIKKFRSELARVTSERDEAMGQAQQMAPELEVARENLLAYAEAVDSLQHQVRHAEVDVAEARHQLADVQAERTVGQRELQAIQERATSQEAELNSLWTELATVTAKAEAAGAEVTKVRESLTTSEQGGETLRAEVADLVKERDSLRRSLSESGLGQELVSIREQLATAEKELKRLSLHSRQLTSDVEAAERVRKDRDDLIRTLKTEIDTARRAAVASSKTKTDNDNEVLRGIIARQNIELEQRHVQLKRLKRARLGVQLVYAAFALALAGILIWAVKVIPKMKSKNPLDFLQSVEESTPRPAPESPGESR